MDIQIETYELFDMKIKNVNRNIRVKIILFGNHEYFEVS